ncbi:hypothetical protein [Rhodococcus qingshengii]|uniref:hypothetical protein n=1 Tax=Rhodococcus qingshengii TaxID=334542 RepID=UPI0002F42EAF|nr:hypothetical protein [Rhodococcus qingshengii]OQM78000.1 hypothetical protein B0E55_06045 [Rhodococcus sp. 66b]ORI30804.1 hypothetical protein BH686_02390 [Rhodococcus erythropolis]
MEHEGGTGSDRDTGHHLAQKNPDSDAEVADVTANVTSADAGRGLLIAEPPSKVAHLPPEIVSRRKNGSCTYTYSAGHDRRVVDGSERRVELSKKKAPRWDSVGSLLLNRPHDRG